MFFWNKAKNTEPVEVTPAERMILYHYNGCFYCKMVRRAVDRLGIEIEYRNILEDPSYRQELYEARGRSTVPVLRGLSKDNDWWMPESRDIVRYLESEFG